MDLADGEEDPLSEITLEISLYSLTGLSSADSIMPHVTVGGVKLWGLVDTGSSHMLIHSMLAQRTSTCWWPTVIRCAALAFVSQPRSLSARRPSPSTASQSVWVASTWFSVFSGCGRWDFSALAMYFWYNGRRPWPLPPLDRSEQPRLRRSRHRRSPRCTGGAAAVLHGHLRGALQPATTMLP